MPDRTLYWMPGTCALAVHLALEAIGEPYRGVEVARDQLKSPEYLALNPMGVVPTLVEDGRVHVEAGAILLHLADAHPTLGPEPLTAGRADLYRWVAFLTGTMHPHFWPFFAPQRYAGPEAMHDAVRTAAQERTAGDWDAIEAALDGRDWLLGDAPTAADFMALPMARWSMRTTRPVTALPRAHAHARRLEAWEPSRRALAAQGLDPLFA